MAEKAGVKERVIPGKPVDEDRVPILRRVLHRRSPKRRRDKAVSADSPAPRRGDPPLLFVDFKIVFTANNAKIRIGIVFEKTVSHR